MDRFGSGECNLGKPIYFAAVVSSYQFFALRSEDKASALVEGDNKALDPGP